MRNIKYKYNIGDTITFKSSFSESACTTLFGLEGKVFKIIDRKDYGGPTYKLFGLEGYFAEDCFAGLAAASVDTPESSFVIQVDTLQGIETKCDTEDSGDSEDLWDVIAELSEIRAGYNLFSDKERAKYHALTVAINKLREEA